MGRVPQAHTLDQVIVISAVMSKVAVIFKLKYFVKKWLYDAFDLY